MKITKPSLKVSLEDSSKTDESFEQQGTSVNIGAGATYNQNCGNQREFTRVMSTMLILLLSLVCDTFIFAFMYRGNGDIMSRLDRFEQNAEKTHRRLESAQDGLRAAQARMEQRHEEVLRKADATHDQILKQAKEGTVWLLRDDVIKTIDFHEATCKITQKQYRRLKDEYEYYISVGGNHDVKDRFEDFFAKIYGTGEVKMVADPPRAE